jgi:hypothetical protein
VPVLEGVDMIYEIRGPLGHGMADGETFAFVTETVIQSATTPARSYTFIDVAQTESTDLSIIVENEKEIIAQVSEKVRANEGIGGLSYAIMDEKVKFYLRGDYGKHDCCAYEAENGLRRLEKGLDGRTYLKMSDVDEEREEADGEAVIVGD